MVTELDPGCWTERSFVDAPCALMFHSVRADVAAYFDCPLNSTRIAEPSQSHYTHLVVTLLSTALLSLLYAFLGHFLELGNLALEELVEEVLKDDGHLLQQELLIVVA